MPGDEKLCDVLVVDSGGFIKNAPLRDLGDEIVTVADVPGEIRDKATKARLQVLPYDLLLKEPGVEDVRHVTEFSKKTGDFASLSAVDLKVLALAFMMEKRMHGGDATHLRTEPLQKTVQFYSPNMTKEAKEQQEKMDVKLIAGFYKPKGEEEEEEERDAVEPEFSSFLYWRDPIPPLDCAAETELISQTSHCSKTSSPPSLRMISHVEHHALEKSEDLAKLDAYFERRSYVVGYLPSWADEFMHSLVAKSKLYQQGRGFHHLQRWMRHVESLTGDQVVGDDGSDANQEELMRVVVAEVLRLGEEHSDQVIQSLEEVAIAADSDEGEKEQGEEVTADDDEADVDTGGDDDEDDSDGWITPGNLSQKRREMNGMKEEDKVQKVKVACMTTDFAMQNVLKQLGMHVLSVEGALIRETKTWLLRCYACFKTTSIMDKKFCQKCGNKTLKRVSCSVREDGTTQIHISTRRQLTGKGKKFPLPAPKGGKHAVNPILSEDQPMAQQRLTRTARQKTDALSDDYTAGNSPFALHDLNSRSAILGVPGKGSKSHLYWMKKNPNEGTRKTGNRKKKSGV